MKNVLYRSLPAAITNLAMTIGVMVFCLVFNIPKDGGGVAKGSGGNRVAVSARAVETECDVRGMNLEEATLAVDMFLDGAVLNKLGQVYIIHGKGTGVLRSGIQQHLKKHPAIRSFRLGKYGEGEDGVTVAELK